MTVSRRKFFGASAAVGVSAGLLAACGPSDKSESGTKESGSASSTTAAPGSFETFLQGKGYSAVAAAPLISGASFNGGLRFDDDTSAYCRIGERSSHTWFVLTHLLGIDAVRNYDGSWTEWGNTVRAPVVDGDQPGSVPAVT
jgi:rhodanese-related sulfurtransferase